MRRVALAGLLLMASALASGEEVSRPYHRVKICDLAAGKVRWTHVEVEGYATYIRTEADGDLHIRICDSPKVTVMDRSRCVVAECIPKMPCPPPDKGSKVAVHGIKRFDNERGHMWAEIHPVEEGFW